MLSWVLGESTHELFTVVKGVVGIHLALFVAHPILDVLLGENNSPSRVQQFLSRLSGISELVSPFQEDKFQC